MFFDGFTLATTRVKGGAVRYRIGGAGPALLLLHGSPQTHAMWHLVAPKLAERFTVVCPDLPRLWRQRKAARYRGPRPLRQDSHGD